MRRRDLWNILLILPLAILSILYFVFVLRFFCRFQNASHLILKDVICDSNSKNKVNHMAGPGSTLVRHDSRFGVYVKAFDSSKVEKESPKKGTIERTFIKNERYGIKPQKVTFHSAHPRAAALWKARAKDYDDNLECNKSKFLESCNHLKGRLNHLKSYARGKYDREKVIELIENVLNIESVFKYFYILINNGSPPGKNEWVKDGIAPILSQFDLKPPHNIFNVEKWRRNSKPSSDQIREDVERCNRVLKIIEVWKEIFPRMATPSISQESLSQSLSQSTQPMDESESETGAGAGSGAGAGAGAGAARTSLVRTTSRVFQDPPASEPDPESDGVDSNLGLSRRSLSIIPGAGAGAGAGVGAQNPEPAGSLSPEPKPLTRTLSILTNVSPLLNPKVPSLGAKKNFVPWQKRGLGS